MEFEGIKVTSSNQDETQIVFEDSKPGLNIFIEENFVNIFTVENSCETFIDIKFDGDLEPLSAKNVLTILKHFSDREFVLRVCSLNSNSFAYYWCAKDTTCVSSAECEKEDICEFLKEFLNAEIQNRKTGVLSGFKSDSKQLINSIELCLIGDERGFNLLFLAAEAGNAKVVQSLLEDGMNVSCLVDGKIPADIAYEKKHLDVLLCLLMANSRFPRNFEMQEEANDCNSMLQISLNLRQAVLNEDHNLVKEILNSNKNLRYFYDTNNESILTYALVNKKFEMYELLMSFHLSFGPREDFDEILQYLNEDEERKLKNLHQGSSHKVVEKHLMILTSNSFVANDNFDVRDKLGYIYDAFDYLNDIPVAKPILKAIAARRDFEIHFDFNRDTTVYLDPSLSGANGLFYLCGRILISAKALLDPDERNEVYGVMIHELGHFAMTLVYENDARPYFPNDLESEQRFEAVSAFCKTRMEAEPLIQSVYEDYEEESFHPELIVRSPQLIAQYYENNEKLELVRNTFAPLHEFFEHQVVPDVEEAIPRIELKADEAYNRALKKISLLQKALWFLFVLLIVSCTAVYFIVHNPTYSWTGLNPGEQMKVLNSTINYRGIEIPLKFLMANESEGFQHLKSDQIKNALDGDTKGLNEALNSVLDQYIYLSPSNLTDPFWDKVRNSNVSFQGHSITLGEIALENSSLRKLSSNQIKSLLSNESISIGNTIELTTFYIQRKFVKDGDSFLYSSSDVFDYVTNSRIFLLADKPGSGKSTAFQALRKEFKEQNPEYWIELIELKNFIEVFKEVKGKSDGDAADHIKQSVMSDFNGLERDLFSDRFNNGKVIFLWDGVDEIAPDFDGNFLSVAVLLFNKSNNIQCISTRPGNAENIKETLEVDHHSLLEYSKKDRDDFIESYLITERKINQTHTLELFNQVAGFVNNISDKQDDYFKSEINNPLLLKMLVDIAIDDKLSKDLDNTYKVYNKFMDLKLNYIATKGINVIESVIKTGFYKRVDEVHMIHALTYIFGDSFDTYLNNTQTLTNSLWTFTDRHHISDGEISKYGILTKSGLKINFVHRSFAEFLVASYLIENIYKQGTLRPEDMANPIALLYNVAYSDIIRKVIQDFISTFLATEDSVEKKFDEKIIQTLRYESLRDYFYIQETAPLFLKFFEKDERVMRILAKIDKYENINDWLDEVLGISLEDKKSFIENNQLGLILMQSWRFEKKGNKVFADFIRKSTKIFEKADSTYRNVTELSVKLSSVEQISEFLNYSSVLLTSKELKPIFINSLHVIDNDFENPDESSYFLNKFEMILDQNETKVALTKVDQNNKALFFKCVTIENEQLNDQILEIIERSLSDTEIIELLTKPDKVHKGTILMNAAQYQDFFFFSKLIDFTRNHTTKDQFRSILLQLDKENDTILQYATFFPHPDNFLFLIDIYKQTVTDDDIRNTFLNRQILKLPAFIDSFKASSDEHQNVIAKVLKKLFENNKPELLEFLSRRNENGDTFFSIYKNDKFFEKKLKPFIDIINDILNANEDKKKILKKLFEGENSND